MLLYLIPFALIVAADQVTKALAAGDRLPFRGIEGLFRINYLENHGAAFGIFQGKKLLLILLSAAIFAWLIWYIVKHRPKSPFLMWSLTLITAGGLGNMIDRLAMGYVRDFIELTFMRFPVFNIADCGVTVGAVMLAIHILIEEHRHGEDDFESDTGCPQ